MQNRAVRSATAMGIAVPGNSGLVTDDCYAFYASLSAGKPGMIIMEHAFVHVDGWANHAQLGIHNDQMIPQHEKLVKVMREADPKGVFCCQLAHAGPVAGGDHIINMDTASVETLKWIPQYFKLAAERAKKAGYDCVQIHSAHNYLLCSSNSPALNHRTDEYKASDFKLLTDVLAAVREVGITVGVKLNCDDFIDDDGMKKEQAAKIIQKLQFDFIEISGGLQDKRCKHITIRQGDTTHYYEHVFDYFKHLNLHKKQPVIITGGYYNIDQCKIALQQGAELIGFSRLFLRDDKFLLKKDPSIKCHRCNQCIIKMFQGGQAYCAVKQALMKKKAVE